MDSLRQVTPPSVLRLTSPGGVVSCFAARIVFGAAVAQSIDPKSQFRPLLVKLFQSTPLVVQPAKPSSEKLAMRLGSFWSTVVAQPVSSRPETVLLSMRCQCAPWSELRHRPWPTTLMTTSPLRRLTTTPEQPPGQTSLTPLFVRPASIAEEVSVHCSAA